MVTPCRTGPAVEFGCSKGLSKSVQVVFHGVEAVMVLSLDNCDIASPVV